MHLTGAIIQMCPKVTGSSEHYTTPSKWRSPEYLGKKDLTLRSKKILGQTRNLRDHSRSMERTWGAPGSRWGRYETGHVGGETVADLGSPC